MAVDVDIDTPLPEKEWPDTISGPIGARWIRLGGMNWGRPTHLPKSHGEGFSVCTFKKPNSNAFVKIVWGPSSGAWVMGSQYWHRWWTERLRHVVGLPTSDPLKTHDGTGFYQTFVSGVFASHPDTGVHEAHGAILTRYGQLGGSRFGYPTSDESAMADGRGRFNHFTDPTQPHVHKGIYWTPTTGAHEVVGAIIDRWSALNFVNGFLGYPTSGELIAHDGVGRYQTFEGKDGVIVWHPSTGAFEVHGAIKAKYGELGGSAWGYPITNESKAARSRFDAREGRFNHFRHIDSGDERSIYWSPKTGAHPVTGAIRQRWADAGWERGPLGYPRGAVTAWPEGGPGAQQQVFEGGRILWAPGVGKPYAVTSDLDDCSVEVTPSGGNPPLTVKLRVSLPIDLWVSKIRWEVRQGGQKVAAYPTSGPGPFLSPFTFQASHTFTQGGNYEAVAIITGTGRHGANSATKSVPVSIGSTTTPTIPTTPNLLFTGPPQWIKETNRIEIGFKNASKVDAGGFRISAQVNNVALGELVFQGLPAGQTGKASFSPGFLEPGSYSYNFVLDVYDTVKEANEDDNSYNGYFEVRPPK